MDVPYPSKQNIQADPEQEIASEDHIIASLCNFNFPILFLILQQTKILITPKKKNTNSCLLSNLLYMLLNSRLAVIKVLRCLLPTATEKLTRRKTLLFRPLRAFSL